MGTRIKGAPSFPSCRTHGGGGRNVLQSNLSCSSRVDSSTAVVPWMKRGWMLRFVLASVSSQPSRFPCERSTSLGARCWRRSTWIKPSSKRQVGRAEQGQRRHDAYKQCSCSMFTAFVPVVDSSTTKHNIRVPVGEPAGC